MCGLAFDALQPPLEIPSGAEVNTVRALVFVSADELERIGFLGHTFPPVYFWAPERNAGDDTTFGGGDR